VEDDSPGEGDYYDELVKRGKMLHSRVEDSKVEESDNYDEDFMDDDESVPIPPKPTELAKPEAPAKVEAPVKAEAPHKECSIDESSERPSTVHDKSVASKTKSVEASENFNDYGEDEDYDDEEEEEEE